MKQFIRLLSIFAIILTGLTVFVFNARPVLAACVIVDENWGGTFQANYYVTAGHSYHVVSTYYNGEIRDDFVWTADSDGVTWDYLPESGHITVTDLDCAGNGAIQWFTGGDSRVNPMPGDHMAIYCNKKSNPQTLAVWGVLPPRKGIPLVTFTLGDLIKAGPKGIIRDLGENGIVVAALYPPNTFGISWINGPLNGNGQADFRKTVKCDFPAQ